MSRDRPIDPSISCKQCGASLRSESKYCRYCDTPFDLDLNALKTSTAKRQNNLECPDCEIVMTTIEIEVEKNFTIESCQKCRGVFFYSWELREFLKCYHTEPGRFNSLRLDELANCPEKPQETTVAYRKCPLCQEFMIRINPGYRSGVIIDYCESHGSWLDSGELKHLIRWSEAGGKDFDALREENRAFEREVSPLVDKEFERLEEKGERIMCSKDWDRSGHDSLFKVILDAIKKIFNR